MRFSLAELQAVVCDMTEALREQGIGSGEVEEILNALHAGRKAVPQRLDAFSTTFSHRSARERFKNAGFITCKPAGPRVDLPIAKRESK